jgi:DNA-binding MarR family transcriptional regulator
VEKDLVAANPYANRMQSIGHLSRIAFRDFSSALGRRFSKHGVSPGQWRFLRPLLEGDGITQRQLAERAGATEATTVRTVRSLLKSGLVERRDDPVDARKFRIFLTTRAKRLERVLLAYVAEVHEIALQGISKRDVETTRRVLITIHRNFMQHGDLGAFDEDRAM